MANDAGTGHAGAGGAGMGDGGWRRRYGVANGDLRWQYKGWPRAAGGIGASAAGVDASSDGPGGVGAAGGGARAGEGGIEAVASRDGAVGVGPSGVGYGEAVGIGASAAGWAGGVAGTGAGGGVGAGGVAGAAAGGVGAGGVAGAAGGVGAGGVAGAAGGAGGVGAAVAGLAEGLDLDSVAAAGLNLFADEFMFPVMVISESDLAHNIDTVARFCADSGVSLSPHGKTTMSPELAHRQLAAGAWAITASTASQARIFRAFDISRILIAHQVVDPAAVTWMADELDAHPEVDLLCLVDSVKGIEIMEAALAGRPPSRRRIDGLVELGLPAGRTGCRTLEEAEAVAQRIAASDRLRLVGVEGYEGILHFRGDDFGEVDEFLGRMRLLVERLAAAGHFDHLDEVIVTAGGSMFPDRVVAILGSDWDIGRPVRPVIRPGGYVTHDSKLYADSGPFGVRAPMDTYPALRPALMLWSYVVSRPEPDLALMGFGKRDVSYDVDLPIPKVVRRDGAMTDADGRLEVFELNDQHGFVRISPGFDLEVGDLLGCGISHPCASFDRWRAIPITDDNHNIVGAVRTFF